MKKYYLSSVLLMALIAVGCSSDDLVDDSAGHASGSDSDAIGFNVKVGNTTRATAAAANHYEFGVFAYNGSEKPVLKASGQETNNTVMQNYLVAYGSQTGYAANTTPYIYYTAATNSATWGNTSDDSNTDSRKGYSSWFYDGISSDAAAIAYNQPDYTQVIKYWNQSKAYTTFYAYTPYTKTGASQTGHNPTQITLSGKNLTFTGLSSFYTDTVKKPVADADYTLAKSYQVSTANLGAAENFTAVNETNLTTYNKEIINYNEATYAHTDVEKLNYGNDVQLDFKHLNAKISLKFTCSVTGYNFEILNLMPDAIAKGSGDTPDPAYAISRQTGVVLTPSTQQQASTPLSETQPTEGSAYITAAELVAKDITTTTTGPTLSYTNTDNKISTATNTNLYFEPSATPKTWLYVLPNWDGENYLAGYPDACKKTGYTLHVSYKLTPTDGAIPIKIYDARVWIPADVCRWQAGKQYTYNIKITDASTGTTDPGNEPDPANDDEPYFDPDDPRVPKDLALTPIVFDGVTVADYDGATDADDDYEISTYEFHAQNAHYFISASAIQSGVIAQLGTPSNPTDVFVSASTDYKKVSGKESAVKNGSWEYISGEHLFKFTLDQASKASDGTCHTAYFEAASYGVDKATAYIWNADGIAYILKATKSGDKWTAEFEVVEDTPADGTTDPATYKFNTATSVAKAYIVLLKGTVTPTDNTKGTTDNHDWVQLWAGGPKFATTNLGETEVTGKTQTYAWTESGSETDAATTNWSSNWKVPTKDEMNELLLAASSTGSEKVTCTYTTYNSDGEHWGFLFTGTTTGYTGNSIFLPAFLPAPNGYSDLGIANYWSGSAVDSKGWRLYLRYDYYSGGWSSDWSSDVASFEYLVRPVLKN